MGNSMIYLSIRKENIEEANKWCKENVDFQGGENTFTLNKVDRDGNKFCLISLPDDGSEYNKKMIEKFGKHNEDPRKVEVNAPTVLPIIKDGKITNQTQITASIGKKMMLVDMISEKLQIKNEEEIIL